MNPGEAVAHAITPDASVNADGTAAHFRVKNSDGVVVLQGTVGTSGADINFNSVAFVAGGSCAISSFKVVQPAGS